ncbi:hypothetical protein B0H11DRAFT_2244138 [Mycena galericulata]|nr:hypothetical protein B0H11DRAFT_2244138 [Mycena galericulata]
MDPSLVRLIQQNGVPTDMQAVQIKRLIEAGEAELFQLGQTSATLTLLLAELRLQSSHHSASLKLFRGAVSAFRRLPPEILGEIFVMVLRADTRRMSIADQRRAPQLLGQVCSYWHSLPQLWTKMVFSEKTAVDRTTASILRNLLARSQNLPLSLSIVEGSNVPAVVGDGNTQFFEILWESRHRFKDLSLNFSPERVAHFLPRIFARDIAFPNLEFLSLVVHGGDIFPHVSGIDSVLRAFRHSPLLHSLDLWYQGSPTPPLSLSVFPWSQLTHLRICMGITLAETRNILLHCRGLESARISLDINLASVS